MTLAYTCAVVCMYKYKYTHTHTSHTKKVFFTEITANRTQEKILGAVVCACNISTKDMETGGSLGNTSEFLVQRDPFHKIS